MIAVARGAQNPGNCDAILDVASRCFIVLQLQASSLRSPLPDLKLPGCYGIDTFHLVTLYMQTGARISIK